MENNWSYIGVFLDDDSRLKLRQYMVSKVGCPRDWKLYCHHLTLAFNNGSEESEYVAKYYQNKMGKKRTIEVTGIGVSDRAIAAQVFWLDRITNKMPHVTIATAPDAKPVESNHITNWKETETLILSGTIGYLGKKDGKIHFENKINNVKKI